MFIVFGSISTKTTVAPLNTNASAVETNVYDGIITSSPSLISHKRAAISVACVHDVVRSALAVFVFSSSHALHFLVNSPSPQIFLFSTAFLI